MGLLVIFSTVKNFTLPEKCAEFPLSCRHEMLAVNYFGPTQGLAFVAF
jgi:hypothetical protein